MMVCEKCEGPCTNPEDEFGEFVCTQCVENAAEAAYDRHMESFHDGGSTAWKTLQEQQAEAWKLK
jgi:transcription initiation factor TFIIIB Brf1 subunit/transcription initiation factor TFIIB